MMIFRVGWNADTDPPLSPLPTEGGEENITGQSLADGLTSLEEADSQ